MRPVAGVAVLDYYLVGPDRLVVEELVLDDDGTAVGLDGTTWAPDDGGWHGCAALSRAMRADPRVRGRVAALDRRAAADAYHRLGGGVLPGEAALRARFHERVPLDAGPPLRLHAGGPPRYRILFAGDLAPEALAGLRASWQMTDGGTGRVAGTARPDLADGHLAWDLRRVGPGPAWCVDLTVDRPDAVAAVLRALVATARRHGLIPVTVERF